MTFALIIHGGAGANPAYDYTEQTAHMRELIAAGANWLSVGMNAVDAVTKAVQALEESGLYVAGKGSAPNADGRIELDASIMDGATQRAGAVAAIGCVIHPVEAARRVMCDGRHVLLAGDGATAFAQSQGLAFAEDPDRYYTDHVKHGSQVQSAAHGTVGAVALDVNGNLAAATSTGGTFGKRSGRVGDTPLIGAGTWADETVAVSCTGLGESFIRAGAAHDVAARMRYGGTGLRDASDAVLAEVKRFGGDGGLIAVSKDGQIAMPYNSHGMKRAAVTSDMEPTVRVFEPE